MPVTVDFQTKSVKVNFQTKFGLINRMCLELGIFKKMSIQFRQFLFQFPLNWLTSSLTCEERTEWRIELSLTLSLWRSLSHRN